MPINDIDDFDWDNLMCNWCRKVKADLLHNDEPLCVDCADLTLERYATLTMYPGLIDMLPPLRER